MNLRWFSFLISLVSCAAPLPNVLIIGDSISMGYTPEVKTMLQGRADVSHPTVNCGSTIVGLEGLQKWLGDTKWDVIHFNWGLHDLCYRNPAVKANAGRDKVHGTISVPLDKYRQNLEELVVALEKTGSRLIWASTTLVPDGESGRFTGDDVKYNRAAEEIMSKHGIPIDDLYTLTKEFPASLFQAPGNVHYTKDGYRRLAEQVSRSIETALPR